MGDAKESRHAVGQLAGGAAEQKTERTRDRCQRCAQFMADGCDELVLQPVDPLAIADVDDAIEHEQAIDGVDWIQSDFDGKLASVPPQPEQGVARFDTADLGMFGVARAVPGVVLAHPLRNENLNGLSDQVRCAGSRTAARSRY